MNSLPSLDSPLSEELKKKFDQIKKDLENLKDLILKDYRKNLVGFALLPPRVAMKGQEPLEERRELEDKDAINVLMLLNNPADKKLNKFDFADKASIEVNKLAKTVDPKIKIQVLLLDELKENCFDGKYELLQMIAMGATIYDPKDFLAAIRISEIHKSMVLKKFDKYIVSYIAAGSLFRGDKKSNDIDVYVVVDDTDVKRMSRFELKDKLRAIIIGQGLEAAKITGVNKQFHIQTYILTDFWESVKDANPVIFTFLRDGVPLYDRGVFMPWKLLLKMGRIKPSSEAIDMQMELGEKLLERTRGKLLSVVGEDLYYAMLNPAQAALMTYGLNPATPAETINLLRETFVQKEKLLEEKYVKNLEEIRKYYKDIEHGALKDVKGAEIDRLLKGAHEYLQRIKKLFNVLEGRSETIKDKKMHAEVEESLKDLFSFYGVKNKPELGLKKLVGEKKISKQQLDRYCELQDARKKLSKAESQKLRRVARLFVRRIGENIQKRKSKAIEKSAYILKYGDKQCKAYLFENVIFLLEEEESKKGQVVKIEVKNHKFGKPSKIELKEFYDYLTTVVVPVHATLTEKYLKEFEKVFGKEVTLYLH
ncbi:hypothetical protein HY500_00615 [Candidatus Woesearchaeota archaeon]|nr:hypothetical protein [Candidatus Woesearchaeota archaeon]